MNVMKNGLSTLMNSTAPFYAPEGEGAPGGGADTVAPGEQGNDTIAGGADTVAAGGVDTLIGAGNDTQSPGVQDTVSPWGDADDELKEFIGEKTPAQIAKELQNAQSLLGKKQVGIPTAESTPEEWAKFHEARGVPKDADGYDFASVREDILKDVPEGERDAAWNKDEEKRFREIAKASNLNSTEANEVLKRELSHRMEGQAKIAAENAKAATAAKDLITQNWGNKAEEFTQDANNFARHMGLGDDVIKAMTEMAGSNADARFKLVDYMRTQGQLLNEGGQPGATTGGANPASSMTPDQATAAKAQFLATGDNKEAYNDANHPRYAAVTAQMTQYLQAERAAKK